MTISQRLLDSFKEQNGLTADNQAAKMLGYARSNISMIRSGKTGFSEQTTIDLAKSTGYDVKHALLQRLIEQAKSDEMRQILEDIEKKINAVDQ